MNKDFIKFIGVLVFWFIVGPPIVMLLMRWIAICADFFLDLP